MLVQIGNDIHNMAVSHRRSSFTEGQAAAKAV